MSLSHSRMRHNAVLLYQAADHIPVEMCIRDRALIHALAIDLLGGRNDNAAHIRMNLATLEDRRRLAHVIEATISAAANNSLVDQMCIRDSR